MIVLVKIMIPFQKAEIISGNWRKMGSSFTMRFLCGRNSYGTQPDRVFFSFMYLLHTLDSLDSFLLAGHVD